MLYSKTVKKIIVCTGKEVGDIHHVCQKHMLEAGIS